MRRSKIHTGYGIMPRVTHCTDDEGWGQPGSGKKVFVARSISQKGSWMSVDKILERVDNKYWKVEVTDFKSKMLGFSKFVGEWQTTELQPGKVVIDYTYTMHSDICLLYPLNWLFTKMFWRVYMKRVLEIIRKMTENNEPYLYP